LISVGFKLLRISDLQRIERILEVLILVHFKPCRMSSSNNCADFLELAVGMKSRRGLVRSATRDRTGAAKRAAEIEREESRCFDLIPPYSMILTVCQ
jgi:hypothetical protein